MGLLVTWVTAKDMVKFGKVAEMEIDTWEVNENEFEEYIISYFQKVPLLRRGELGQWLERDMKSRNVTICRIWNEDNDGMNASETEKFQSPYGSMAFDRKGGSSSVVKIGKKENGTKWK